MFVKERLIQKIFSMEKYTYLKFRERTFSLFLLPSLSGTLSPNECWFVCERAQDRDLLVGVGVWWCERDRHRLAAPEQEDDSLSEKRVKFTRRQRRRRKEKSRVVLWATATTSWATATRTIKAAAQTVKTPPLFLLFFEFLSVLFYNFAYNSSGASFIAFNLSFEVNCTWIKGKLS